MEINEKLNILEDNGDLIQFEEVTVKTDSVSRAEVTAIKNQIAQLEQEDQEIQNKIAEYKKQLEKAEMIIAKADAEAQAKAETQMQDSSVEVTDNF